MDSGTRARMAAMGVVAVGGLTVGAGGQSLELQQHLLATDGASAEEFGVSVAADGNVRPRRVPSGRRPGDERRLGVRVPLRRHRVGPGAEAAARGRRDPGPLRVLRRSGRPRGGRGGGVGRRSGRLGGGPCTCTGTTPRPGQWNQEAKLFASDAEDGAQFGYAIGVSDNAILVGASNDGSNVGAAYVFRNYGAGWVQEQKLTASDGLTNEFFGASVGLSGDMAIVGKYGDDTNGGNAGSAYIFRRTGSTWIQEQKLVPAGTGSDDLFGASVAASGNVAVIGARHDDDSGTNAGAAYIYRFNGSSWALDRKLLATDGQAWDKFGRSVAADGQHRGRSGRGGTTTATSPTAARCTSIASPGRTGWKRTCSGTRWAGSTTTSATPSRSRATWSPARRGERRRQRQQLRLAVPLRRRRRRRRSRFGLQRQRRVRRGRHRGRDEHRLRRIGRPRRMRGPLRLRRQRHARLLRERLRQRRHPGRLRDRLQRQRHAR